MRPYRQLWSSLIALLVVLAPAAQGQFTITDGNAVYRLSDIPIGPTDETPDTDFQPDGTVDHLWEDGWWFRLAGDTRESAFHSPVGQDVSGNTATLHFSYAGFTADIQYLLTDGPAAGQASLVQTISITNTGAADLFITLFHQADVDVNGTEANDFAQLVGENRIRYFDSTTPAYVSVIDPDANNWSVHDKDAADLEDLLTDAAIYNAINDGLPFGIADPQHTFQWNLTIGAGETKSIGTGIYANLVPEPASVTILLAGGLLMLRRRRRVA